MATEAAVRDIPQQQQQSASPQVKLFQESAADRMTTAQCIEQAQVVTRGEMKRCGANATSQFFSVIAPLDSKTKNTIAYGEIVERRDPNPEDPDGAELTTLFLNATHTEPWSVTVETHWVSDKMRKAILSTYAQKTAKNWFLR